MRTLTALILLTLAASPLAAQKTERVKKDDEKSQATERSKDQRDRAKKDEAKASEKKEADGGTKRRSVEVRLPTMPDIQDPKSKKEMVSAYTNVADKDISAMGLKGKTAKEYRKGMAELGEEEYEIQANAVKRRDEVLRAMVKELATLTGKTVVDITRREYLLLYGAAMMRPEQYRALREDRNDRPNAFTALVEETGKTVEEVKATATTIRALLAEDNPFAFYQKIQQARLAFNGTIKNIFTPEEYFEYLTLKGIDKAPKNENVDNTYLKALRSLELTENQSDRIKKVLREREMADEVKREKVNDILSEAQRKQLQEALKPKGSASKK